MITKRYEIAEHVLPGHPDKICDAAVDGIVDFIRRRDPDGQCGLEAACVFDRIFLTGRIASREDVLDELKPQLEKMVRDTYKSAGYGEDSSGYIWGPVPAEIRVDTEFCFGPFETGERESRFLADDQAICIGYANHLEDTAHLPPAHWLATRVKTVQPWLFRYDNIIPLRKFVHPGIAVHGIYLPRRHLYSERIGWVFTGGVKTDPEGFALVHRKHDAAVLRPLGRRSVREVIYMPNGEFSQSWREGVRFPIIGKTQRALKVNRERCLGMNLRKRKLERVILQFNHCDSSITSLRPGFRGLSAVQRGRAGLSVPVSGWRRGLDVS